MINKLLVLQGKLRQSEDSKIVSLIFDDQELFLSQTLSHYFDDIQEKNMVLMVNASFLLKSNKKGFVFNRRNCDMSIENSLLLKTDQDNIEIPDLLIDLYQQNGSDLFDSVVEYHINQLIGSGQLATEIDELDKYNQDWTYEEAKYALEIYKASMKMDTIGLNHLIDDYIRTGKLQRTVSAIKYKLANFKHLETLEDEGLGNVGQVFKDVFFEKK